MKDHGHDLIISSLLQFLDYFVLERNGMVQIIAMKQRSGQHYSPPKTTIGGASV